CIELFIALLGTGLKAVDGYGAGYVPGFGSPRFIGNLLLTRFLLVFEVASFILLVAAVGGVVLARRRGGIEEAEDSYGPLALPLPQGAGSMAEAVGGLSLAAAHAADAAAAERPEPEPGARGGG